MATWNKFIWTEDMDRMITEVYLRKERNGNKRLAKLFGIRGGLISARAARLGLPSLIVISQRNPSYAFKPDEIALVRKHLGEPIAKIRAHLYRKGFSRSLNSIAGLIARRRHSGEWPSLYELVDERDHLLTSAICEGMGVPVQQVQRWANKGLIKYRKASNLQFCITRNDLRQFLITYPGHWDHRTADRWFLLDILLGDEAVMASRKVAYAA